MRISKNYQLSEFEYSITARDRGIDNTIPAFAVNNIRILVDHLLQPINDATGWQNLISSGYRSKKLNEAVGGTNNSQHTKGQAADCKFYVRTDGGVKYIRPVDVARKVLELGLDFDQMILYPTFVHLSFNARGNRKQTLYSRSYNLEKI